MQSMDPAADVRQIPLTGGGYALVDADDFALVDEQRWYLAKMGYAIANIRLPDGKRKTMGMHRYLMGDPPNTTVDHINRDKLDNRRCNLRLATYSQNMTNQPAREGSASGLKGVYKYPSGGSLPWFAAIRINGKLVRLGRFQTKDDAARCYDAVASKVYGEFGVLNHGSTGDIF